MVELGVLRPVLVEDEEDLLCSTEGEDGQKDSTTSTDDVVDESCSRKNGQC